MFQAQVLLQHSRNVGLDLGQVGYQAVATSCVQRTDGIQLLKKMMVSVKGHIRLSAHVHVEVYVCLLTLE